MGQGADATPLPFACSSDDGSGSVTLDLADLNAKRVTQCALSRICGVCAQSLGRPIGFVGTSLEVGRNAFHFPPVHTECAPSLLRQLPDYEFVTTAGFEFVRSNREDEDRRPTFQPNSLL
jgi:hypothetical protein